MLQRNILSEILSYVLTRILSCYCGFGDRDEKDTGYDDANLQENLWEGNYEAGKKRLICFGEIMTERNPMFHYAGVGELASCSQPLEAIGEGLEGK